VSPVRIVFGRREITVLVDDHEPMVLPVGIDSLVERSLSADPPRPEELTNVIGEVFDHFDDVVRERPTVVGADVHVQGDELRVIAAVEVGGRASLPFVLTRDAAEDVFRTMVTESNAQRAHNPGFDPAMAGTIVAGCCALVAMMRRLQLDDVTVQA
jgi:exopolyphosphatase/guanosine-5'-triphosphate,3'-diphosphate pyrophosphatase